jgi:hypothetical protein
MAYEGVTSWSDLIQTNIEFIEGRRQNTFYHHGAPFQDVQHLKDDLLLLHQGYGIFTHHVQVHTREGECSTRGSLSFACPPKVAAALVPSLLADDRLYTFSKHGDVIRHNCPNELRLSEPLGTCFTLKDHIETTEIVAHANDIKNPRVGDLLQSAVHLFIAFREFPSISSEEITSCLLESLPKTFKEIVRGMMWYKMKPGGWIETEEDVGRATSHITRTIGYLYRMASDYLDQGILIIVSLKREDYRSEGAIRLVVNVCEPSDDDRKKYRIEKGKTFGVWLMLFTGDTCSGEVSFHFPLDYTAVFSAAEWEEIMATKVEAKRNTQSEKLALPGMCLNCGLICEKDPVVCSKCELANYCSIACQADDYTVHAQACLQRK